MVTGPLTGCQVSLPTLPPGSYRCAMCLKDLEVLRLPMASMVFVHGEHLGRPGLVEATWFQIQEALLHKVIQELRNEA